MSQPSGERLEAFLKDMAELAEKHGITIDGCGCCGSPSLNDMTDEERGGHYTANPDDLCWNKAVSQPTKRDAAPGTDGGPPDDYEKGLL